MHRWIVHIAHSHVCWVCAHLYSHTLHTHTLHTHPTHTTHTLPVTDAGGVSAEEVAARLGALSTAARGLLGEASIARGLLMAGFLEGRWRISQERVLLGGKGKVLLKE